MITNGNSPVRPATWSDLRDELDRWRECGRCATLWWRDDDAVSASRQLDALLNIAGDIPLALAVIPARVDGGLAMRLDAAPNVAVRVVQHGWRHQDHGASGKKSEFPATRPRADIARELRCGREHLRGLFGSRALAVLAPPWNRFAPALLPLLAESGIAALSQIKPRPSRWPADGVFAANIHVDLVAWRDDRGFIGEDRALGGLVGHLRARRLGHVDPDEPTGILTHHLVQDEATAAFLRRLLDATCRDRAARWLGAEEVFAPGLLALGTAGRA